MTKTKDTTVSEDEALANAAAEYIAAVTEITKGMPEIPEAVRSCNMSAMWIQAVVRAYIEAVEIDLQPEIPFAVGLAFGCLVGQLDNDSRVFSIQSMLNGLNQGISSIETISNTVGRMQ